MNGYIIILLIVIAGVGGFGFGYSYCDGQFAKKVDKEQAKEIVTHDKEQAIILKDDTLSTQERATYDAKIDTLQQQLATAQKAGIASPSKPCIVPAIIVRNINSTAAIH